MGRTTNSTTASADRVNVPLLLLAALALALAGCGEAERPTPAAAPERGEDETWTDEALEQAEEARELVRDAAVVAQEMRTEEDLRLLIDGARGVFVLPDYGKGAIGVGARGGEGVLVVRTGDGWSGPAFYDLGAVSLGAQVGGSAGAIVMLLMSESAVAPFKEETTFSLNADAGFSLLDYSARAQESVGKGGDVVLWSDMEGAFAGVSLGVTAINWDGEENDAYYGEPVQALDVLNGLVRPPFDDPFRMELEQGGGGPVAPTGPGVLGP